MMETTIIKHPNAHTAKWKNRRITAMSNDDGILIIMKRMIDDAKTGTLQQSAILRGKATELSFGISLDGAERLAEVLTRECRRTRRRLALEKQLKEL